MKRNAMNTHYIGYWIVIFALISGATASKSHKSHKNPPARESRLLSISTRFTNDCSQRKTSGLICQDCNLLARCVRINGNWKTIPVEQCNSEAGEYCNVAARGCSNATGPCNPLGFEGNFPCRSVGVFPDPYDCQKYHLCYRIGKTKVSETLECGGDRAFSPATGDCSLSLNDAVCTQSQYRCHYPGDSETWPGNRNIFYICHAKVNRGHRVLFPTLYRCAAGEVFNGSDCVTRQGEVNNNRNALVPFKCRKGGLFVDANDCKSYYYCDYSLRWLRYTCEHGTHFDDRVKACMRGKC